MPTEQDNKVPEDWLACACDWCYGYELGAESFFIDPPPYEDWIKWHPNGIQRNLS